MVVTVVSCNINGLFSLISSFGTVNMSTIVAKSRARVEGTRGVVLPNIKTFKSTVTGLHGAKLSGIVVSRMGGNGRLLNVYLNVRLLFRGDCRCNRRRNLNLVGNDVGPVTRIVPASFGVPRVN